MKEEQKIRNNPKFKILDSTNAGLRFQNKSLREFNEDYLEKKKNYDDCQKTVVDEIMDIAGIQIFLEVLKNFPQVLNPDISVQLVMLARF